MTAVTVQAVGWSLLGVAVVVVFRWPDCPPWVVRGLVGAGSVVGLTGVRMGAT